MNDRLLTDEQISNSINNYGFTNQGDFDDILKLVKEQIDAQDAETLRAIGIELEKRYTKARTASQIDHMLGSIITALKSGRLPGETK